MVENTKNKKDSYLLIVEDDESHRKSLTDIMEGEDFDVIGCSTAAEALEYIRNLNVWVVLLDLKLPDISETDLLQKLDAYTDRIHFIINTGYGSFNSAKQAINIGAFAYVEKADDPEELVRHVHRAFQSRFRFYTEELETAVDERTRELQVVNEVLKQDITERKKAEEEIGLFARTVAEKNRELESIINIAAHDLRTPLVNIKGFGDLLENNLQHLRSIVNQSKVPDNLKNELETIFTEDIYQNLKFIKMGTEMLDSLLKALLRLARLGRAAVDFQKLNMNEMMNNIAGSMKYHLDTKNVKLTIEPLPHCYGDKAMVGEVFLNLLGNAVKYLDPSRPGLITLSGSKKKDRVVYCVRDNGFGIDPELQEHVFDIFYRIRHGQQHVDGEGMGLTIVRRIMDFHDGKVWLESEKGIGSKFYVSFPAAEKRLPKRILEIKKGIVPSGTIPRQESYR